MAEEGRLIYVEIDIPVCALTYGVAPCTASIPTTGAAKCFNSRASCQDLANFSESSVTLRFAGDVSYLPQDIDCIPSIENWSLSPGSIKPGEGLGERTVVTVTLKDHPHSDTGEGFDKYLSDRTYDPVAQGTFWGKFQARQPYMRGRNFRLRMGKVGQALAEMETRHFFVESIVGPGPDSRVTIVAKDIFKQTDGDRAMAPVMSNGFLNADLSSSATNTTLSPSGIGSQYPTGGFINIGGKEVVGFARSGDSLTLSRGQLGTTAAAHKAQDRCQLVLSVDGEDVADIIATLLADYADVPSDLIPLTDWKAETAAFLGTVYTATICEPTPVRKLVNELIEQAALVVWYDDVARLIRLNVLRAIALDAKLFNEENILKGSFSVGLLSEKRISQVWTYYAQRDPTKSLDDLDNYAQTAVNVNADAEANEEGPAVKVITSRWIPALGRQIAQTLNTKILTRYERAPRKISLATMRDSDSDVALGGGYQLGWHVFQNFDGSRVSLPAQVTRLSPASDRFLVEMEESRFTAIPDVPVDRTLTVDSNMFNINLRDAHDSIFPEPEEGDEVTLVIQSGATLGSTSISVAALIIGEWPEGVAVKVIVRGGGRIQGCGGSGGSGGGPAPSNVPAPTPGAPGGPALYTRSPIELVIEGGGEIFGGGGGGGGGGPPANAGGGGGGGAGSNPGAGGAAGPGAYPGGPGTRNAGGAAGLGGFGNGDEIGGNGGAPGLAGSPGQSLFGAATLGGAAGRAIDGVSFCDISNAGDVRGPQVN